MKKMIFACLAAALAAGTFTSCKNTSAEVRNDVDSISYAAGVMYSDGLLDYQINRNGLDSAYVKEFIKGIKDGAKDKSAKEKAYNAGLMIGDQIKNQIFPMINEQILGNDSARVVNEEVFFDTFIRALNGEAMDMTSDKAQIFIREASEKNHEKQMEAQYGANKAAGKAWLENNKTADGVVTTESGLQYKIIKLGNGEKPSATDRVVCNYRGTLIDGTEFDSSYKRNEPTTFALNSVIPGWTEGFQLMPAGSKFELYIPYELAYKAQDRGNIKQFSTLIFEIEFLKIEK
ncbi:MAG: FKBP-type peptidyl-prolyl cis-trans isomerase [Paludibacteraceae bacterium]|nr:FKBP-type peptidyl-prolyl cis-trans isomerase [Paludibacteraceae bacterium]